MQLAIAICDKKICISKKNSTKEKRPSWFLYFCTIAASRAKHNTPHRVYLPVFAYFCTLWGIIYKNYIDNIPVRVYNKLTMKEIAVFIKQKRKEAGLTQEEFAIRSGLGLRFVRELEQGKETVRMDKVNQALAMFGAVAVPGKMSDNEKEES